MTTAADTAPLVTVENGPRPAGRDDECFYCHQRLGEHHLETCPTWTRTVRLRAIIEFTDEVPRSWTAQDILEHRNHGTWCASSLLEGDYLVPEDADCLCPVTRIEVVEG